MAFVYFDICHYHYLVANIKIWKSHLNIREGSDYHYTNNCSYLHDNSISKFDFTGVYLLDFFCSGIQFNLLLSPYPCFISLLYLDLYVLGDDALIS